jgi:hypothetical protein
MCFMGLFSIYFEKPEGGGWGFVVSHLASKERSQNGARCIWAGTGLSARLADSWVHRGFQEAEGGGFGGDQFGLDA